MTTKGYRLQSPLSQPVENPVRETKVHLTEPGTLPFPIRLRQTARITAPSARYMPLLTKGLLCRYIKRAVSLNHPFSMTDRRSDSILVASDRPYSPHRGGDSANAWLTPAFTFSLKAHFSANNIRSQHMYAQKRGWREKGGEATLSVSRRYFFFFSGFLPDSIQK